MIDYEVSRCTRRCAVSGRELRPGEAIWSYLVEERDAVTRRDVASEAWTGAPDEAIGWWQTRLPKPAGGPPKMLPGPTVVGRFDRLVEQQADPQLIAVMALLLVRKRWLRDDEHDGPAERNETTRWRLNSPLNDRVYELERPQIDPRHAARLQQALLELLYGEDDTEGLDSQEANESDHEDAADAAEKRAERGRDG
ncbi:MAG TPA: hypothetical protein DCQ98_14705 [Planctomycetaceae bacterium]|nr:hypothetical protein [Planctomycetaceae bacterium]HRF00983.1 hypothetical protein [Pirellulaceae bacterium]